MDLKRITKIPTHKTYIPNALLPMPSKYQYRKKIFSFIKQCREYFQDRSCCPQIEYTLYYVCCLRKSIHLLLIYLGDFCKYIPTYNTNDRFSIKKIIIINILITLFNASSFTDVAAICKSIFQLSNLPKHIHNISIIYRYLRIESIWI